MSPSATLAHALLDLGRKITNLNCFLIHPITDGLPDGWAGAMNSEITTGAAAAVDAALALEDERAAAERRTPAIETATIADIHELRRTALSLIAFLAAHSDLAVIRFDNWPEEVYRRPVNELDAINRRLLAEARNLLADRPPSGTQAISIIHQCPVAIDPHAAAVAYMINAQRQGDRVTVVRLAEVMQIDRQALYSNKEHAETRRLAREMFGLFRPEKRLGDWQGPKGTKGKDRTIEAVDPNAEHPD